MANLLVVSGYWPSRTNPISGVFIVEQIRAFTELGHNVWVVVGQAIGRRKDLLSLVELGLDEKTVTMLSPKFLRAPEQMSHHPFFFSRNVKNTGAYILRAIQGVQDCGIRFDGALVHGLRYGVPSAPIWKPTLNAPAVGLIHGVDPLLNNEQLPAPIVELISSGLRHFDSVGIVGTFLKEFLNTIGLDHGQFKLVLNGTEVPTKSSLHTREVGDSPLPKRILSVSRLCAWKGVDDTLRALGQLKHDVGKSDWQLRIVGQGEEQDALEKLARKLGIIEHVHFTGRLDRQATLAEFEQCDLFCLPSWAEPFGIVYLEAMARARPIIGCNNCGPADFVTSGSDGVLVSPKDPAALADAIRMLWDSPERLAKIGAEGRKTAETFTWQRNVRQICTLLGVS